MSCPALTTDPRSTLIESTNPVTLGKTATTSYAGSSPGKLRARESFLDTTSVASTMGEGAAGPCAPAAAVDEPDFALQETKKPIQLATVKPNRTLCFIEPLQVEESDCQRAASRTRFADPRDRVTGISLPLAAGPSKTPGAESEASLPWLKTSRRSPRVREEPFVGLPPRFPGPWESFRRSWPCWSSGWAACEFAPRRWQRHSRRSPPGGALPQQ